MGVSQGFALEDYEIPSNMKALFKANFNEFVGISENQRQLLISIRKTFKSFQRTGSLTKHSYTTMLRMLLHLEELQMEKNLKRYRVSNKTLTYLTDHDLETRLILELPGLKEKRPSVIRGDVVIVTDENGLEFDGEVHKVKNAEIILQFYDEFYEEHYENKSYSVSFMLNRFPLRAEHQAVELIERHNAFGSLFRDRLPSKTLQNYYLNWFNPDLANNEMQRTAVLHIVAKTAYPMPYIVFGPPGTGKTVAIVEAILQLWAASSNERILVCTPSNSAANEITRRLSQHVPCTDLYRFLSSSFSPELIPDVIKPYTNFEDDDYYQPTKEYLMKFRIMVTTLVYASKLINEGIPPHHFSHVFIDESGQATESATLIPIAGILTNETSDLYGKIKGQIVLAGDPKQLGPVVQSKLARKYGFGMSMLERLMNTNPLYKKDWNGRYNPNFITKLVNSHRSHPSIIELPNVFFYDRELVSVGDINIINAGLYWRELPNPYFPIIFHSVLGEDRQEENSPSYFNPMEVNVVMYYLQKLLQEGINGIKVTTEQIGVISPYKKQCEKIRRAFNTFCEDDLDVGSVETFQGREKLVIIISTVRSRPDLAEIDIKHQLGFLEDPKRFNVAITRAKALLIVIGNPNLLQYDQHWGAFIDYCLIHRACTGALFQLQGVCMSRINAGFAGLSI